MFKENKYWVEIEKKIINDLEEILTSQPDFDLNRKDDYGNSILHLCSRTAMMELTKFLLENNAHVDVKENNERTPLMLASYHGFQDIVNLLLSWNANAEATDIYGFNASVYAIYSDNRDVYSILTSRSESECANEVNSFLGSMTHLTLAASLGKIEIAKYLLTKMPASINARVEKSGMTPLMLAICGEHNEMVEQLIRNGADLQLASSCGLSSLAYARRLNFPLLKLNIPDIRVDEEEDISAQRKRKLHPLTPNIYISPVRSVKSPKQALNWIKTTMTSKRSKSLERSKKNKFEENTNSDNDNILKSILDLSKMEHYWPLFKEQEITFSTFLTLNEDDLKCIGITKSSARITLLNLVEHYRKIFNSQ